MVIVRARVASSQTRFSPTMILYSTTILGCCIVQLKKMADLSPGSEVLATLQPFAGNQVMELVDLG